MSPIITTPSIISHYPELNLIPSHQEPCLDKGGAGKIPVQIRSETKKSCFGIMSAFKLKYPLNITTAYLNINSIANKFDNLKLMIEQNLDIFCID